VKEETRRAIAFSALTRISGRAGSSLYSYNKGTYAAMSGNQSGGYDYEVGAHFSGSGSSLYHYGTGGHISLQVNGRSFSGYDYSDGHHFFRQCKRSLDPAL
jgi:hypothetical protein